MQIRYVLLVSVALESTQCSLLGGASVSHINSHHGPSHSHTMHHLQHSPDIAHGEVRKLPVSPIKSTIPNEKISAFFVSLPDDHVPSSLGDRFHLKPKTSATNSKPAIVFEIPSNRYEEDLLEKRRFRYFVAQHPSARNKPTSNFVRRSGLGHVPKKEVNGVRVESKQTSTTEHNVPFELPPPSEKMVPPARFMKENKPASGFLQRFGMVNASKNQLNGNRVQNRKTSTTGHNIPFKLPPPNENIVPPDRVIKEKYSFANNFIKAIASSAGHHDVKISRAKLILSNVGKSNRHQFSPNVKENHKDDVPHFVKQILSDTFSMPVQDSATFGKNSSITLGNLIFSDYWPQPSEKSSSNPTTVPRATSYSNISRGFRRTAAPSHKAIYFQTSPPDTNSEKANIHSDNNGRHTKSSSSSNASGVSFSSTRRPFSMIQLPERNFVFSSSENPVQEQNLHQNRFDDTLLSETDNTFDEDQASSSDDNFADIFTRTDNIGRPFISSSFFNAFGSFMRSSSKSKLPEHKSVFSGLQKSVEESNSHQKRFDDTLLSETDNKFSEDTASSTDDFLGDIFIPNADDDIFHSSHLSSSSPMTRTNIPGSSPLVVTGHIPLQCVMSCGPTCPYCIVL